MRITTQQYAQALYEMTKDKSPEEVDVVLEKFVKNLQKEGKLSQVKDIIEKFEKIYNKENGIIRASVSTSREIDDTVQKEIEKTLKEKYNAREIEMEMKVDKNLKGGMKIVVGENILDNSVAGKLGVLRSRLVG